MVVCSIIETCFKLSELTDFLHEDTNRKSLSVSHIGKVALVLKH